MAEKYVLDSVISHAFLRETSKLALEFYRSRGVAIAFQWADHNFEEIKTEPHDLIHQKWWKNEFPEEGLRIAPIMVSEMNHAKKLIEKFKNDDGFRFKKI